MLAGRLALQGSLALIPGLDATRAAYRAALEQESGV